LQHVATGARFDKEDKMGLTALHLAALMQNDKVDAALGATAPTSAPGLRWPHLRRDCVRSVAPGEQLRLTPRVWWFVHVARWMRLHYPYLFLPLPLRLCPYLYQIFVYIYIYVHNLQLSISTWSLQASS
jgi:hypothetical protein